MNLKRILSCIVFCSAFLLAQAAFAEMVAVKKDKVNMRSGPSTKNGVLWEIGQGFPLQVVKRSGDWIQVKDFEGSVGWVRKDMVSNQSHVVVKANKGSGKTVNVRSAPSTNGDVVATAIYAVCFKVVSQKNGWVQVEHANGVKGWIRKDLLWGL